MVAKSVYSNSEECWFEAEPRHFISCGNYDLGHKMHHLTKIHIQGLWCAFIGHIWLPINKCSDYIYIYIRLNCSKKQVLEMEECLLMLRASKSSGGIPYFWTEVYVKRYPLRVWVIIDPCLACHKREQNVTSRVYWYKWSSASQA